MVQSVKEAWQTAPTGTNALTVAGLSTLATNTPATSNTVDNYNAGANQFPEVIVQVSITTGASGVSASGYCEVYLKPSLDNSNFADSTNDILLEVISMTVNATTYKRVFGVSKGLQGTMPPYFQLRFNNQSGAAFTAATVVTNGSYFTVG